MIQPKNFVETVLAWQGTHGRHQLPWQHPATPYRVLVSEIMLQQTQVATVIPYFERWMQRFPTLVSLADASEDEVMSLWQGLGYYRRARNLQKAARFLVEEQAGEFPRDLTEIQKIPGVGRYTAGAIKSFAYNEYGPIVDGNVRRLFCRLFGVHGVPTTSQVDKQLWQLAESYTPNHSNRRFAQALLDLGATLCTARNPQCSQCPLAEHCVALKTDTVQALPTAKPKKTNPERTGHFLWLQHDCQIYLQKRPPHGIWASLWSLPEVAEVPANAVLQGQFQHTFSHYKLNAKVWSLPLTPNDTVHEPGQEKWVSRTQLDAVGLPAPIRKYIEEQEG